MLVGQFEVTVDDKHRIILPAKTNSEKDDCLVLMYDDMIECYRIYNKTTIEKRFKELDQLILSSKSKKEERRYKIMSLEFSKSILRDFVVDSQRRIALGSEFEYKEKLSLIGGNDHLILERRRTEK